MTSLSGKTLFITGASRGIGAAMARRFAQDGANIAVIAKTSEPHPKLPGTIHTVAKEVEEAGGKALPLVCDVRDEEQIQKAVDATVSEFGGIDVLVNNASALWLKGTLETPMKRFDLMQQCNARATFACSQACIPHLSKAENPHILSMSPPLNMNPKWFAGHVAYTMSKYGMSFCTLGMSLEFADQDIAVNSLWPRTTIATAAIKAFFPQEAYERSRKTEIVAEAAYAIVTKKSRECTGNFFIDEEVLREKGIEDFSQYAMDPEKDLQPDLFV